MQTTDRDGEDFARLEDALAATAEQLTRRRDADDAGGDWAHRALARLTAAAVAQIPGAVYAGLTMREPDGGLSSHARSSTGIIELDRAQARLGEGPCVDAISAHEPATTVIVDDFADEDHRWPRFAPLARDIGVVSVLSFAMAPHNATPGALNIYAMRRGAFDPTARAIAATFATQAAVAVYGADRVAHLERALATRDMIGQAKGILMERFTLDDAQAFDLLVSSSQDTNIKLIDVARWLTGAAVERARRDPGGGATGTEEPPHRLGEAGSA